VAEYTGTELPCIEPEYNALLNPKTTRRMSRVIKIAMAAALDALKKANTPEIDGIITGTGLGCLDDTGNFLLKLSDNNNRLMNPTAFIQSTHNTVGSQIALHLGNKGYNCTHSHLDFSFEYAFQDALLLLKNNEVSNLLVGSYDELTPHLSILLRRLQYTRQQPVKNTELFKALSPGTIAGEGCSYFVLSTMHAQNSLARISDFQMLYKPTSKQLNQICLAINENFKNSVAIIGKNGYPTYDSQYLEFETLCNNMPIFNYKHLSGSFPTSAGFAVWLALEIINMKKVPFYIDRNKKIEHVYIYHCNNNYHSLMRFDKC